MDWRGLLLVAMIADATSAVARTTCPTDYAGPRGHALAITDNGMGDVKKRESRTDYLRGADPFAFVDTAGLRHIFTTNRPRVNVPVYRAANEEAWLPLGDALPQLPSWSSPGHTWAPEVIRLGAGRYALWYTARERASGRQCVGRAVAAHPEGPYTDASLTPFLCDPQKETTIDPSPFRDEDGRLYLLWKTKQTVSGAIRTALWIGALDDEGNFREGTARELLGNDAPMEGDHVEAPTLVREAGRYFLFYSAGASTGRGYFSTYAVATRAEGPYRKSGAVLLGGGPCMRGAGHQSVVVGADGEYLIYFHAVHPERRADSDRHARFLDYAHLCFVNGTPTVQDGRCANSQGNKQ